MTENSLFKRRALIRFYPPFWRKSRPCSASFTRLINPLQRVSKLVHRRIHKRIKREKFVGGKKEEGKTADGVNLVEIERNYPCAFVHIY